MIKQKHISNLKVGMITKLGRYKLIDLPILNKQICNKNFWIDSDYSFPKTHGLKISRRHLHLVVNVVNMSHMRWLRAVISASVYCTLDVFLLSQTLDCELCSLTLSHMPCNGLFFLWGGRTKKLAIHTFPALHDQQPNLQICQRPLANLSVFQNCYSIYNFHATTCTFLFVLQPIVGAPLCVLFPFLGIASTTWVINIRAKTPWVINNQCWHFGVIPISSIIFLPTMDDDAN